MSKTFDYDEAQKLIRADKVRVLDRVGSVEAVVLGYFISLSLDKPSSENEPYWLRMTCLYTWLQDLGGYRKNELPDEVNFIHERYFNVNNPRFKNALHDLRRDANDPEVDKYVIVDAAKIIIKASTN